jgi:hypothetical protein
MAANGRFFRSMWGADAFVYASQFIPTTVAMASLNSGWCGRFTAQGTRDVKSVWVRWSTVTAPGTVQLRIETVDATTGKPTGTLYDANAVLSFTPSSGAQQLTFATPPTTGLVDGTDYAVVLLTTVGGTALTLYSHTSTALTAGAYPAIVLTAADGTTRTNFAEVSNATPAAFSFVYSDNSEEVPGGWTPYYQNNSDSVYGTNAGGMKFIIPANVTFNVAGVELFNASPTGTPLSLRARIWDSTNTIIATRVANQKMMTGYTGNKRARFMFASPVALVGGTYRAMFDQTDHTTLVGNRWNLQYTTPRVSSFIPQGFIRTTTANIDATPPTWTDDSASQPMIAMIVDDIPDVAGRVSGPLIIGG